MKFKRLGIYILIFLTFWLMHHIGRWFFMPYLLLLFIFMPLISFLFILYMRGRIVARVVRQKDEVYRNESAAWILSLENKSLFYHARLYLTTPVPLNEGRHVNVEHNIYLRAGSKTDFAIRCAADHCGYLALEDMKVAISDFFNFVTLPLTLPRLAPQDGEILVLPLDQKQIIPDPETKLIQLSGDFRSRHSFQDLDEIDHMRKMAAGDSMRTIHWKMSARMQNWYVKKYEKAENRQVVFILNLPDLNALPVQTEEDSEDTRENLLELRDYFLERMLAICFEFIERGYPCAISLYLANSREGQRERLTNLEDLERLRKELAMIPLAPLVTVEDQVEKELAVMDRNIIYMLTTELNPDMSDRIRLLASENAALYIDMIWQEQDFFHKYSDPAKRRDLDLFVTDLSAAKIQIRKLLYSRGGARYAK